MQKEEMMQPEDFRSLAQMNAERKRRSKGRRHPGGCGRLTNAGYCGLDWHDSNHKPVVCNHCKKIK